MTRWSEKNALKVRCYSCSRYMWIPEATRKHLTPGCNVMGWQHVVAGGYPRMCRSTWFCPEHLSDIVRFEIENGRIRHPEPGRPGTER